MCGRSAHVAADPESGPLPHSLDACSTASLASHGPAWPQPRSQHRAGTHAHGADRKPESLAAAPVLPEPSAAQTGLHLNFSICEGSMSLLWGPQAASWGPSLQSSPPGSLVHPLKGSLHPSVRAYPPLASCKPTLLCTAHHTQCWAKKQPSRFPPHSESRWGVRGATAPDFTSLYRETDCAAFHMEDGPLLIAHEVRAAGDADNTATSCEQKH